MLDRFPVAPNQSVPDAARKRIVLLPGSRRDEIRRHLPILEETAMAIQQVCPAEFITVFPNQEAKNFAAGFSANSSLIRGQVGDLGGALTGATLAIASTGTVTMECALFGVPTVAMYRTSWLTYWIGRAIVTVDYLAMPNLLANAPVFPELIQAEATPEKIAAAALDLLNNPLKIGVVRSKLKEIIQSLGGPGASARAASAVLGLLKN